MNAKKATIRDFISGEGANLPALAEFLEQLEPDARVDAVRSLRASEQARLYEAAAGYRAVRLTDFVPERTPPLRQVIHRGRNSLPVSNIFEKRFCLPDRNGELWGYNEHRLRVLTGPGYFVARHSGELEVTIDYSSLPSSKPASWPEIVPNSARLGRFVFDGLVDVLRGVSGHVTVGRATKDGKPLNTWFALCRSDGDE
jgi:hypothetical protein